MATPEEACHWDSEKSETQKAINNKLKMEVAGLV